MRRFVDPAVLVFAAALIGSLGFHLPLYEVLGVLATRLELRDAERAAARRSMAEDDVEMELVYEPDPPPTPEAPETPEVARPEPPTRERPARPREATPPVPVAPPPVAVPTPPTPPPPPPPAQAEPEHAITQRSRDPNVEPPPEARFAADENSRVEEETVARDRSMVADDPEPEPAPSEERSREPAEDPGDREEAVADLEDREGEDRRAAASGAEQSARVAMAVTTPPAGGGQSERVPEPSRAEPRPPERRGGGEDPRYETVTITDGSGTFVIRRPRPRGEGAGDAGGVASTGPGGRRRVEEGERGGGRGPGRPGPVDLNVRFSQLESIVGRDALEEERQAYVERRRSRRRGTDHAENWHRFRTAIENFVPNVRPGNQTALNARASPFAGYTAEVHRRLHEPFHEFLFGVAASGPLADQDLETKLEIVLNRDGSVHQVGVVRQSGQMLFDHGAFAAVHAGAPYPVAPDAILSGDGRVYLRWTFKRAEPFCHQIHAERYILDNAAPAQAPPQSGGAPAHEAPPRTVTPLAPAPHGARAQRSSDGPA